MRVRPFLQGEASERSKHDRQVVVQALAADAAAASSSAAALAAASGAGAAAAVLVDLGPDQVKEFRFDRVFGPTSTQEQVFATVGAPLVEHVLAGYNASLLAYGQTGTGKTYTMGILERVHADGSGIVPRALHKLVADLQASASEWTMTLSFVQIYMENVYDLLAPENGSLSVREDAARGFFVPGLTEMPVRTVDQAVAVVNLGLEARVLAPTLMNATSSRSHTLLQVNVRRRRVGAERLGNAASASAAMHRTTHGKLVLVDLAGSERVKKTNSDGARLDEARSINTSLSALGNVIAALADRRPAHVRARQRASRV